MEDKLLLAYLAGIVDGEGYVSNINRSRGSSDKTKYKRFIIRVGMITKEIIDLLQNTFGGTIWVEKRDPYPTIYRWEVSHKKAREVYHKLKPYLRLKGKGLDIPAP